jgi:hypothetical protein
MTVEAKGDPTTEEGNVNHIAKVMKENEGFLRRNAEEDYGEVIDLINDAIDLLGDAVEREEDREDYVKYSTVFFLHNILMPSSYGIQTNLLTGNLPTCFMQLRLMTESLGKCYLADRKYPDEKFFQKKLELLEKETKNKNGNNIPKKDYEFLKEFDETVNSEGGPIINLWGKLSKDWMHTKGVIDNVVSQTNNNSTPPSWALILPMTYARVDLDTIQDLGKRISQFRYIFNATMKEFGQILK